MWLLVVNFGWVGPRCTRDSEIYVRPCFANIIDTEFCNGYGAHLISSLEKKKYRAEPKACTIACVLAVHARAGSWFNGYILMVGFAWLLTAIFTAVTDLRRTRA